MAVSVNLIASLKTTDNETAVGVVTFDSSYPDGGEALTASDFGLENIQAVIADGSSVATKRVTWNSATQLLQIMVEDGTSGIEAEAADASDQSAVLANVIVVGK